MPRYIEVVAAVSETATKILALRQHGRAWKVEVTTGGGETASVSWSDHHSIATLNMPTLPPDAVLTRGEADRLVAFIGHECCHVLHSDRTAWERAVAAGNRVRDWTNALEDVRIEFAEIRARHFPALQGLLAGMANKLHYDAVVEAGKHGRVIGAAVRDAPYVACIMGRLANGYPIPSAMGLSGDMSPQVSQLLDVALAGIRRAANTDQVVELARQLAGMEKTFPPVQPPPNQKGPGEPQDSQNGQGEPQDNQNGQGDSQGDSQGEPQDGQDGQGTADKPQDGQDGQGTAGEPQNGQGTAGEPQDEPQDGEGAGQGTGADLTSMVEAIAKRAGYDIEDAGMTGDRSAELSVTRSETAQATGTWAYAPLHATELTSRLPRNSVLHSQIGRLLVSAEIHRVTHRESAGRLDRRALVRMQVGAPDVYSRRDDTPGIDTALMILIDGSSSMRGSVNPGRPPGTPAISRMQVAQTAAWHIARAAESANAKVMVASFHTRMVHHQPAPGATITVIKPWQTAAADCAAMIASVEAQGATPLSPAIIHTAGLLAEANATRHILMVITDGDCDLGPQAVTRACAVARDIGVETVAIGMNCASVTAAFPPRYSVDVADMTQLAEKGLGALVAMLEDANPRGADD